MRNKQEVEVEILPGGIVKIDFIGFQGIACEQLAQKISQALGAKITSSKKKSEFYAQVSEFNQVSVGKPGKEGMAPGMGSGMS